MTTSILNLTDVQLWGIGSAEAFGELFVRHARAGQSFCLKRTADPALAEDLTSVVFVVAWQKRARVRITTSTARPYLLGVASNVLRHQARSLRRQRVALADSAANKLGARGVAMDVRPRGARIAGGPEIDASGTPHGVVVARHRV